jgi:hypothetical protein
MVAFEEGGGEARYVGVEIGVALAGSNSPSAVFASQVGLDNDPGVCPKMFPLTLDVVRRSQLEQVRIVVAFGKQSQEMLTNCRVGYIASIHHFTEHE